MTITMSNLDSLTPVVDREMTRWSIPGIVVGVLRDGAVERVPSASPSCLTGRPCGKTASSAWPVSKVFTATLAMILADDGLLDIDRPIIEYLPDLPLADTTARRTLTVRMLLSHQSGLYGDFFIDMGLGEDALARAIAEFGGLRQMTAPGERWAYCNSGFHLTGRVLEVVSGQPFDVLMRERLFKPLGLERTCYFAHEAIVWPHAAGHNPVSPAADEHIVAPQGYPRNRLPAGGVVTNAPELLRFAALHLGDGAVDGTRVLSAEAARAMRTPQIKAANFADQWGIGWDIRDFGGTQVISHGGSINGFQTHLTLVPEQGVAIAILTNSARGSAAVRNIEPAALEQVCGLRAPERPRVTLSDAESARYAGRYEQPGPRSRSARPTVDWSWNSRWKTHDARTDAVSDGSTRADWRRGFHHHRRGDGGLASQFHSDAGRGRRALRPVGRPAGGPDCVARPGWRAETGRITTMASDFMQKLGEVVERERERFKVPGISVGILRDGKVEAAGYGVGSLDTNDAVSSETLFQIGSNSKVFTTTLLMTLVDEGKVNLDAPITDYLPNLKLKDEAALEKMRVRHFVSHQTGLWGDYFEDFGWGDDAISKAVAKAVEMPQMYQPEELWAYTNINFTIVGKLIEDELGQTFEAAMKERVFDPLEMQRSFYFPWEVIVWPHAVGHTAAKPGEKEVEPARNFWLNRQLGPAGAISSNVHDVLAFDKFHLTGKTPTGKPVISDKARAAMQQPQIIAANFVDEWALGWWLYKVDGAQIVGHGGGTNGFITRNTLIPQQNMAWAIFTNSARGGQPSATSSAGCWPKRPA